MTMHHIKEKSISIPLWRYLSLILFLIVFILICATFTDYGITTDEPARKEYGYKVLFWYSSFFQNKEAVQNIITNLHGGFFEVTAQFFAGITVLTTGGYLYETRHFINALFGLIGIVFTYKLGKLISGEKAGFFSALILTLTPRYYGHLFNNPKDIPFAVLFLISMYYIFLSYRHFPKLPKKLIAKLGVSIGLTLGVRIGGMLLYGYFIVAFLAWFFNRLYLQGDMTEEISEHIKIFIRFSTSLFWLIVISWLIMLLWWPWAQISPIKRPFQALSIVSEFPWKGVMLFKGDFIKATNTPWDYIFTWLFISLPEFYFFLILFGAISAWKHLNVQPQIASSTHRFSIEILILIFVTLFPIVYVIYKKSVLYDGIRHFIFILPFLSVICGISFVSIFKCIKILSVKYAFMTFILFQMLITVYDMATLHPYQSTYFNRLVAGGLPGAADEFEIDYWGNAYKEASEWVIDHYSTNNDESYLVVACLFPKEIISYYMNPKAYLERDLAKLKLIFHLDKDYGASNKKALNSKFEIGQKQDNEDYCDIFMAHRRWDCHKNIAGNLRHIITINKTPVVFIYEPPG